MIRRGTVREDGRIFWCYKVRKNKKRYECWLTPEQFKEWDAKRIQYAKRKRAEYNAQQKALPPEERNYIGKYDPATGLYFLQIMTNGKPQYGTFEKLQEFKEKALKRSKNYSKKCKAQLPLPNVCVGDDHPTDKNLVVVKIWNRRIYYGTRESLQAKREKQRERERIYRQKESISERRRIMRNEVFEHLKKNPHLRMKRGYQNPITKELFWCYNSFGKEMWLRPDEFVRRRNRSIEVRNLKRKKATNS